jgi:hypothetical protein
MIAAGRLTKSASKGATEHDRAAHEVNKHEKQAMLSQAYSF